MNLRKKSRFILSGILIFSGTSVMANEEPEVNIKEMKSKTMFVVDDDINMCSMKSKRDFIMEQKILMPESFFNGEKLESFNIYYGYNKELSEKEFKSEEELKSFLENLNKSKFIVFENNYFKRDSAEKEGRVNLFIPEESNQKTLNIRPEDVPGEKWPSFLFIEFNKNQKNHYIKTKIEKYDDFKNAPKVFPFSVKIKNGKIETKGVKEIKGNYTVNYTLKYEDLAPEFFIMKSNGFEESQKFIRSIPNPDKISSIDIFYDLNKDNYDINFDSQYRVNILDIEDHFFDSCDPKIDGFERINKERKRGQEE